MSDTTNCTADHYFRGPGGEWRPRPGDAVAKAICDEIASGLADITPDETARRDTASGSVRDGGQVYDFECAYEWDGEGFEKMKLEVRTEGA